MNRHLIAAATLAVTALASGNAAAADIYTGTLQGWYSQLNNTVADPDMTFTLDSWGSLDPTKIGVAIKEIAPDRYDVGFSFSQVSYTGGDSIIYRMAVIPANDRITEAQLSTIVAPIDIHQPSFNAVAKVVAAPGVTLFSSGGTPSAWTSIGQQKNITVTDTVFPSVNGYYNDLHNNFQVTAVPEPETYAMMLAGLAALSFMGRRRQAK